MRTIIEKAIVLATTPLMRFLTRTEGYWYFGESWIEEGNQAIIDGKIVKIRDGPTQYKYRSWRWVEPSLGYEKRKALGQVFA